MHQHHRSHWAAFSCATHWQKGLVLVPRSRSGWLLVLDNLRPPRRQQAPARRSDLTGSTPSFYTTTARGDTTTTTQQRRRWPWQYGTAARVTVPHLLMRPSHHHTTRASKQDKGPITERDTEHGSEKIRYQHASVVQNKCSSFVCRVKEK